MMNFKVIELAQKAGFALWIDDKWKPPGAVVDWSSDYDNELEKFYFLAIEDAKEQGVISDAAYKAWRRREAYAVPLTEEGQEKAQERLEEFNRGFTAGIKSAMYVLENMHRENKHEHNFYLFANRVVQSVLKDN